MESIVTDMTNQCKIVETLLIHANWFFNDNTNEENVPIAIATPGKTDEFETHTNQELLLLNISKYEALKDTKEKNGALFSSIISAAQRKVKRKPNKSSSSLSECKDVPITTTNLKVFPTQSFTTSDIKETSTPNTKSLETIPTPDIERTKKTFEKVPWFNYSTDKDEFYKRIQNFKQETEAMLQLPRKLEISINNIDSRSLEQFGFSDRNGNLNSTDPRTRITNTESARNNVSSVNSDAFSLPFVNNKNNVMVYEQILECGNHEKSTDHNGKTILKNNIRKSGSEENVNSGSMVSDGRLKKVKYGSEIPSQKIGSLDSLNKISNDDDSLLITMTKLIDRKLNEENFRALPIASEVVTFIDDYPEKLHLSNKNSYGGKDILPANLYRNPSLHKRQYSLSKLTKKGFKKQQTETEKEEDTTVYRYIPDNDKLINTITTSSPNKLKRSESLNKADYPTFSLTKLKRSESLNKSEHKLKRADSLTKSEKTENNINKKRELCLSNKKIKDCNRNKRKTGVPVRPIKRRHTVGGTKDLENIKDTNLRTSSPDLSSSGRENIFFEINVICPENMMVALKQHLIGTRPQSFPESTVYKVPLESHV